MSRETERALFVEAHLAWGRGDFEGFMALLDDDVTYIVNVDGIQVPYAMSAVGKEDARGRFQLLLETFEVTTFDVLKVIDGEDHFTSAVHGVYRHKATKEILDVRVRFRGWLRNGKFVRIEEIHDARYVEAFERFVFHIQNAANKGC
jgi:ketosteroid isomerase-like protein